jgi:hypothetical protein
MAFEDVWIQTVEEEGWLYGTVETQTGIFFVIYWSGKHPNQLKKNKK